MGEGKKAQSKGDPLEKNEGETWGTIKTPPKRKSSLKFFQPTKNPAKRLCLNPFVDRFAFGTPDYKNRPPEKNISRKAVQKNAEGCSKFLTGWAWIPGMPWGGVWGTVETGGQ